MAEQPMSRKLQTPVTTPIVGLIPAEKVRFLRSDRGGDCRQPQVASPTGMDAGWHVAMSGFSDLQFA